MSEAMANPSWVYLSVGFMRIIVPQIGASSVLRGTAGAQAGYCAAIVRVMYDDDYRVTSVPYRVMPQRKRPGPSGLGEALDAARPDVREALDAANGTAPEPSPAAGDFSWAASRPARQWSRRLGRALSRKDNWTLIIITIGVIAGVATAVIGYLTLVKPR
jgi:hypothetical protein